MNRVHCSYRKTRVQCSCCQECNVPACVLRGIECNARIERRECNARVVRNAMFLRVFVNESSALVRIGELSEMLFFHLRVDTVLCFYFTSYLCVSANANGFLQLAPSERYSSSIFFVILMPACLRPRHKQRYSSSVFFTLILVCWGWLAGQNFPKKSEKCQKAKKHCFYKLKKRKSE